ncbi:MAG: two component response regulator [uncultured bacterium]|nr:MAG: two component response regulator [uncultured bacterium]
MSSTRIACCYYPTTVVFIDDSRSFLDNVSLEIDENISIVSFAEPKEAVEHLQKHTLDSFAEKYLRSLQDNESLEEFDCSNVEHSCVDVNVIDIHKEIYNPDRFNAVTVAVVDYTMPGMNGLELCKALKDQPIKFILITGYATVNNAIEAFNAGVIHQFIQKNDCDFTSKLHNAIYELQEKQFEEHSDIIIKSLLTNRHSVGLGDPLLIDFLKKFFKENNIVEYYLVNDSGCFLMADARGNLSWMVIKSEEEMKQYTAIAIDNYGDQKVIEALQSRKEVLFLRTEEDFIDVTVDDWGKHLHPATKIIGKNDVYYYSHLKDMGNGVFPSKVISYEKFLTAK